MSKDPAHTPRRVLPPPAVTRFHLRTAPASEAVFVPPFLPPRTEGQRYSRKAPPVTYAEFPEPVIRRQPPALPPASRPLELSPPAAPPPESIEPPAQDRTAPGTWREIIARFEAEYTEAPEPKPVESRPDEPTEPPSWEVEAMTTADYAAPRSIHDPEHDSWPVDAQDGDAVPAWDVEESGDTTDDDAQIPVDTSGGYEDIGELVLDDVVAAEEWDDELEPADAAADFPLDAFIVPAGVQNIPTGYDAEHVAQLVAHRLDELAQQLRDGGIGALGKASSVDELSRVLAAIVTGYVARDQV